jgi:hypothetical protein
LLLVFSLFASLGQSAMFAFGIRWVIALVVIVSGSAAVLAARLRLTTKKGEEKVTTN